MDNRTLIIERAHQLLMSIGPTSMTMDMVARTCGISKRTIYETFPDKKTLVVECLNYEQKTREQEACKIYNNASNCFEALFAIFHDLRDRHDKRAITFINEIKRLYPEITAHQRKNEKAFINQLSGVLSQAQDEGLVVEKINTEIASFIFYSQMHSLHRNSSIEDLGFDQVTVFEAAFVNFLRGIATIKGIDIIEEAINNYLR